MTIPSLRSASPTLQFCVELTHVPAINFAIEQSGVPLITDAQLSNSGASASSPLELVLSIEPDLADKQTFPVGVLRPGEPIEISIDFRLRAGRLRSVVEAERAELLWELRDSVAAVASGRSPIEVLAYNEWPGLRAPPALLACFVTPNDPAIERLVGQVRDRLGEQTGDRSISGYQTRSQARVRKTIQALYDTIQASGVTYIGVPASYEDVGQKIRFADTVLRNRQGNCIDLTILVASCLEHMGLSPLIVIERGHAYPGAWLSDDRFYEGVVYDAARLRTTHALEQLLFFDSSAMLQDPRIPLEVAEGIARDALDAQERFVCALDIVQARRDRYRPLPLRDADPPTPDAPQMLQRAIVPLPQRAVANDAPRRGPQPIPSENDKRSALNARFRIWREKLLDLSLRNKLLNFRLDTKSALPLEVPDIAKFEDLLAADHMFQVHPRSKDPRDRRDEQLVHARGGNETRRAGQLEDLAKNVLHTPLDEAGLSKQAIQLKRAAREAIEEGGANVLYVALGILKWFESDSSETERLAPLLLVPVALEYARDTRKVQLRRLPEETLPNWTLVEKMRADFGVELEALTAIEPDDSGVDVPAMLRTVRERIVRMSRWEVLEEAHVGTFSFTKYLMWRDLGDNHDVLLENRVIRRIANRDTTGLPSTGKSIAPERLDDEVSPAELPLVVDADSTQTAAVVSAVRGLSFVLQGPPGTGKSQTITNLIAAALANGKTVLFVSEKMAALEVVYRRLQGVGLGEFCLELHSHKAQKREVIQSLGRTLDRVERTKSVRWSEDSSELAEMRNNLNSYVRALHAGTALGMSFHQVSARLIALGDAPAVRITRGRAEALTRDELQKAILAAAELGDASKQVEPVASSPFRDCLVDGWAGQRERDTRDALEQASEALQRVSAARADLCTMVGVDPSLSLLDLGELAELTRTLSAGPLPSCWRNDDDWKNLRDQVHAWHDLSVSQARRRNDLAQRWRPELYRAELADLEPLFKRWAGAFVLFAWLFLFSARKRLLALAASGLPSNRQIAADLPRAIELNHTEQAIEAALRNLRRAFEGCGPVDTSEQIAALIERGERLREAVRRADAKSPIDLRRLIALADAGSTDAQRKAFAETAGNTLAAIAGYLSALHAVQALLAFDQNLLPTDERTHLEKVAALFESWRSHMDGYRAWCLYQARRKALTLAGGAAIAEAHARGQIAGVQCAPALERALLDAWAIATRDANPVLRDFDGARHHALVERYRDADRSHIRGAKQRVSSLLEERLPPRTGDAAGEPAILRRELAKKRNHMPLRKLLQAIPNLLTRLKPCLLMSPLSVAQYLPADGRRFDLVVFDEASQICTHDAIGAIGRGEQLVVVGDSKQLPPTAFFARASGEDVEADENDFTELESILDEACASGMPQQMLGWHYRSRHETLIEFSNHHYYENELNIFPAARADVADLGVKLHLVEDGVYEQGKSRTNPREARALVDLLVEELREAAPASRTFGVVTFSAVQQELVEDLLEDARKRYPEIEPHFADSHPSFEKVFVKNLENVQGDERDEILFSIAYAPDEQGRMIMNFGPVNREGGERRLNVAVTRARKQLRVFSSIRADQIDTNRTRSVGARHLKSFLRFAAERSQSNMRRMEERSGDFDSEFERDVHDLLRASGHQVDTQVGCSGYRIDLAVVHPQVPGVYALGIECDGAAYHSGATARDRDRLRQQVLEGLGWRLHRIWSTDWTYRRNAEIERLLDAVEQASKQELVRSAAPVKIPDPSSAPPASALAPDPTVQAARSPIVPYQRARVKSVSADPDDMYELSKLTVLRNVVAEVLRVEAPMHLDELTRRAGEAFGLQRISSRSRKRIRDMLASVPGYTCQDDFVWHAGAAGGIEQPVRAESGRDADMVPVEEFAAAVRWVLLQALSIAIDDLVRETARILGVGRGAKVDARVRLGLGLLQQRDLCAVDAERVIWRG